MKFIIFFSPSEEKSIEAKNYADKSSENSFLQGLFLSKYLLLHRQNILDIYYKTLENCILNTNLDLLKELTGFNSFNRQPNLIHLCEKSNLFNLCRAIERYSGVGYQGLEYVLLKQSEKDYINKYCFIFSNLFGIIRANDLIPFYKLKQGTKIQGLRLKDIFSSFLKIDLKKELNIDYIIDLRAEIYNSVYKTNLKRIYFSFTKDGKNISHYSKLYRGKILRYLAISRPESYEETIKFLQNIDKFIESSNLIFKDIQYFENNTHISYLVK